MKKKKKRKKRGKQKKGKGSPGFRKGGELKSKQEKEVRPNWGINLGCRIMQVGPEVGVGCWGGKSKEGKKKAKNRKEKQAKKASGLKKKLDLGDRAERKEKEGAKSETPVRNIPFE